MHPPSHLHSNVHLTPALQHLQSPYMSLYNRSVRGWHMPCLRQQRLSKTANISCSSHLIPKSGSICLLTVTCFQIKLSCNTDLLTCSKIAACVGGIVFNEWLPVKNKIYLASLTDDRGGTCLAVPQHNKSFNALHMHTFQSQTFRIVSKGNPCLCQDYVPIHSSHSSWHSSKYGKCAVKEWNNGNANDCWCGICIVMSFAFAFCFLAFATTKPNP